MNGAHIHLLLNHVPVLGSIFALLLLLYGFFSENKTLQITSLVALVIVTLISIPAYLSGEEAEHLVENIIGVNKVAMDAHEDQAEIAFWVLLMNGAIALGTLISAIRTKIISRPLLWINLVMLTIVVALMARTGYTGGQIRHSEINAGSPVELDDENQKD